MAPLDKVADLKRFLPIINGDERNTAILKPADPNRAVVHGGNGYAAALWPTLALRIAASRMPSVSEVWQ